MADTGFPGFMRRSQVAEIHNAGHKIGAHTRTHRDLVQLNQTERPSEIKGSREDLLSWNLGQVLTFAYPFGSYDANVIDMAQNAGYTSAAATLDGYAKPTSDPYQLQRQGITRNVTASTIKSWIDKAMTEKKWLVLSFHSIDYSGTEYSTTPEIFNEIVDYLSAKKIPVVTISQGVSAL
ncbi:MAG: hypothetical protein A3H57_00675 [Candidatus Taylorbacteria bacterium RIFCSPLOWO2_02_FULL_43_11]|uniref:NodB homology domain-containing protein n=1 Tax=Candidatus Taylorbacteria bacterium RIFCSPHIGHO2_02_FULL_43_32b TaxID=1802306 RepID=A0A1G2MIE8_9BACT|nr:MAG: hypothetical protein A2743_04400 [Candidatus Taylorbacteria bacterium RIFCSPHIGHO2_01_FULL_43_47]OHA23685.1 MAG: hypothetical protein A3C72_00420 [Candidatus Taylorbacteria bacterium RIFCSPHIGHO2_02_FULL_43_32b]OHA30648.1 MAG: hypothetical protein A3B08_00445 [Candidatus Taylorbacteria bacterium RIFCSPLOWO2_01_FULL_43_44]OHA37182.1 MAG: hypothetical protein A3H57_00675 [Candidatus Taylorbacteria bacterium RIFCSPLOWO2_02_FULL_43_11]